MQDKTPLVYVAGPYAGTVSHDHHGYHDIERNIAMAREAAAWLAENGLYFFCPHLNSAHFEVITPEVKPSYWYALDLRVLSHCDAMLVVGFWADSYGVKIETAFCRKNGIPVYYYSSPKDKLTLLTAAMEEVLV